jgi:hypothetical protein
MRTLSKKLPLPTSISCPRKYFPNHLRTFHWFQLE